MLPASPAVRNQSMPAKTLPMEGDIGISFEDASQHSDPDAEIVGWLMEAWAKDPTLRSLELPIPKPRMPCLALRSHENGQCSTRIFKGTDLGADKAIKPGSHAFVMVPGEDFVRASITGSVFGMASGHGMLPDEQPVLFAGGIEISEDMELIPPQADSNEMNGRQLVPAHFPKRVPLTKAIHTVCVDPYRDR